MRFPYRLFRVCQVIGTLSVKIVRIGYRVEGYLQEITNFTINKLHYNHGLFLDMRKCDLHHSLLLVDSVLSPLTTILSSGIL